MKNTEVKFNIDCNGINSASFEGATRKPPAMQEVDY
jgi:hypothetical protein